jgi:hypothetical protein
MQDLSNALEVIMQTFCNCDIYTTICSWIFHLGTLLVSVEKPRNYYPKTFIIEEGKKYPYRHNLIR